MDSYITIEKSSYFEYEDRKSVFIGQAYPVKTEEEALAFLTSVKKEYPDAKHHVYAYVIKENSIMRFSDDREPQGTAGKPVLDIIKKNKCVDIIVVVTRYFGGTLLGTGGLVRAYTAAAVGAIEAANVIELKPHMQLEISIGYSDYSKTGSVMAECGFKTEDSDFSDDIKIIGCLPTELLSKFNQKMIEITAGRAKIETIGEKFDF